MTQTIPTEPLKNLLETQNQAIKMFGGRRRRMKSPYLCMEDFVLQEGQPFDHFSPRSRSYKQKTIKQCFNNAFVTAVRSRGNLRYVEGYALGRIIPCIHAWCVDEDDGVVETTWEREWCEGYMGIVFPLGYVRQARKSECLSVIDNWPNGWPLLQQKFDPACL